MKLIHPRGGAIERFKEKIVLLSTTTTCYFFWILIQNGTLLDIIFHMSYDSWYMTHGNTKANIFKIISSIKNAVEKYVNRRVYVGHQI